jgi:hypothetical protein
MAKLKDEAKAYKPQETKNIADLDKVSVDLDVTAETFTDKNEKEFTINVVIIDKEKYRVPTTVLKGLKAQLEERPSLKYFKVKKSGSNMATEYTVIPLE